MTTGNDRIIFEDDQTPRSPRRAGWLGAGAIVVVVLAFLGSVGSPVEAPSDSLPGVTTPIQQPLAIMPHLENNDLLTVVNALRNAGLDAAIIGQSRWVADDRFPHGVVITQYPAPGTEVFDNNQVSLLISAGGPVTAWADIPANFREMVEDTFEIDESEPVLVVPTASGTVYKTDDLLFGPCTAVALASTFFYDQMFDRVCDRGDPQPILGWLADGSMFQIDGLPAQEFQDNATSLRLGDATPLGRQLWSVSTVRRAPEVTFGERTVRVQGGHYAFVISLEGTGFDPEEVAQLVEPLDIRGNLVVNLTAPLEFSPSSTITGSGASASMVGHAARQYRGAADQPFAGQATVQIVSGLDGVAILFPSFNSSATDTDDVLVTFLGPTDWTIVSDSVWQYALPEGWAIPELAGSSGPIALLASTGDASPKWCGIYPIGALAKLQPTGALVAVIPAVTADLIAWPAVLSVDDLPTVDPKGPGNDCLVGVTAEVRRASLSYNGINFDVIIGFGPMATAEVRDRAIAILNTFEPIPVYEES